MKEIVRVKKKDNTYSSIKSLSKQVDYLATQIKRLTEAVYKRRNFRL